MSVEEFIASIDSVIGRPNFELKEIFQRYGIKNIRFTSRKKFKSREVVINDEREIILDVPNVDFGNHFEAAVWMIDFTGAIENLATNQMASRIDGAKVAISENPYWKKFKTVVKGKLGDKTAPVPSGKELWYGETSEGPSMKLDAELLIHEVANIQRELSEYIKQNKSFSLEERNTKLKLSKRSLYPSNIYRARDYTTATASVVPSSLDIGMGWVGPKNPLRSFKASRYSLESRENTQKEIDRLNKQMDLYFTRRKRSTAEMTWKGGVILLGMSALVYSTTVKQGAVNQVIVGMKDEKKNTTELNEIIESTNKATGLQDIRNAISLLETKLTEAKRIENDAIEDGGIDGRTLRTYRENITKIELQIKKLEFLAAPISMDEGFENEGLRKDE